jgi:hypothetical protein
VAPIGSCRITTIDSPLDFISKVSIRDKSKFKRNDWFHDNSRNWSLPLTGLASCTDIILYG